VAGGSREDSADGADRVHRPLLERFFDYGIADEVHELKGETAQGNALGTIASARERTVILTGTLLGGYPGELIRRRSVLSWLRMIDSTICAVAVQISPTFAANLVRAGKGHESVGKNILVAHWRVK
jgi:hypothetical protein